MKIQRIIFNWYIDYNNNDQFQERSVGYNCKEIIEHLPLGEGDRLWYDVIHSDDSIERVFNINSVNFTK